MVLLIVHLCLISSQLCLILLISPQCGSINGVVFPLSFVTASVCVLSLSPCVTSVGFLWLYRLILGLGHTYLLASAE